MFTITGLDHIVLRTSRLQEMLAFYCDILHARVENEQPDIGLIQLRIGHHIIDLVKVAHTSNHDMKNLDHFCLRIKPFDYEQLSTYFEQHHIKISRYGKRYGAQGYGYSFYLHDPEGNELELTASLD